MRRPLVVLALICLGCSAPGPAAAQEPGTVVLVPPRTAEKVWLVVDAGMSAFGGEAYSNEYASPNAFLPSASDTFAVTYHPQGAFATSYGAGYMMTSRLGVGVSRTRVTYEDVVVRTGLSRPRLIRRNGVVNAEGAITFSDTSLSNQSEKAYHLEVSGHVVRTRVLHLRAFAGPSRFRLSQGLVRRLDETAFPIERNGAETAGWGYNAGLDLSAYIPSRHAAVTGIGFGASLRYARADIESVNGLDPAGGPQVYPIGGLTLALGMRGRF
jgi:hypothetical protein